LDRPHQVSGIAQHGAPDHEWGLGKHSIAYIHRFRLYWRFANTANASTDRLPRLNAHYQRMMTRPAVQRTIAIESAIGYNLPP